MVFLNKSGNLPVEISKVALMVARDIKYSEYNLDFSWQSIVRLDLLIDALVGAKIEDSSDFRDYAIYHFGSYLALFIERHLKGTWHQDLENGRLIFISRIACVGFSPFSWLANKIDASESLAYTCTQIVTEIEADRG